MRPVATTIAAITFLAGPAWAADPEPRHPDIDYLAQAMPEAHANAFHTLDRAEFEQRLDQLNELWPTLDRHGAMIELARLTAGLRDGHALVGGLYPFFDESYHRLPIQFYEFSDGLFIRAAHESLSRLVGAKVLKIGDVSAREALDRVYPLISHDNVQSKRSRAPRYLDLTEVLEHLGLSETDHSVTLKIEQDEVVRTVTITPNNAVAAPMPYGLVARDDWVDANTIGGGDVALYLQNPGSDFWHHFDPATGLFFLQVNTFQNEDAFPDHLKDLAEALAGIEVEKFVLDIRNNEGGETGLVRDLTKVLLANRNVNRKGHFFVLIGRRTFSSGQLLVNALSQYSDAVFIGEPTGAGPIFYGNSRPNVHLASRDITLFMPTKVWMTTESDDRRLWHVPDIAAPLSSSDYLENRDPALEAAMEFSGLPDLQQELTQRLFGDTPNLGAALAFYRAYKSDPRYVFADTEAHINALGYRLLGAGKTDDAIAVLALNVDDYPDSANAYDSLGEAYLEGGEWQKAYSFYARSFELDPSNANAERQMKEIEARRRDTD